MSRNEQIVVKNLSPALLDMKFMLKAKKRIENREKKKEQMKLQNTISEIEKDQKIEETEAGSSTSDEKYEICNDLTKLEDLSFGRMSFKGYNKEVEDLMQYYERLKNGELSDDEDNEKDVKDDEMAETLNKSRGSGINKKFMSKRNLKEFNMENNETPAKRSKFNLSEIRKRNTMFEAEPEERKFLKPDY